MRLWNFFVRKRGLGSELDSEIRFHLESVVEEKMRAGLTESEARRQAALEFGGPEQVKEDCRSAHRILFVETAVRNVKSAMRFVRRSPLFAAAVIITLALGIGANSAVFSAIDAVLLKPLPYPAADELVVIRQADRGHEKQGHPIAPVRLEEWNRLSSAFSGIAGFYTQDVSETTGEFPERLVEADVTPRFLQVLGIIPQLGRDFTPAEEHHGGPSAVLISERFWRRRFHGNAAALGKMVRIEQSTATIIGVMPAGFGYPSRDVDIWWSVPVDSPIAQNRRFTWFTGVGRLRPGVSIATARADLSAVQAQLGKQYPETDGELVATVRSLKETVVADVRRSLWILFGSVTLLLLIACINVAALLLARTTERSQEVALRYSLGASRSSIVMQLLTETLVLALTGGIAGIAVAYAGLKLLRSMATALPRLSEISLDSRLVAYTLCCACAATLLCGLLPALMASRRSLSATMATRSRTQVGSGARLQFALVGVQVALAVTLLVGAGLLLRSFRELGRVALGFDPNHVLTFRVSGNYGETADQAKMFQHMKRLLDGVAAIPGVQSSAMSAGVPGGDYGYPVQMKVVGSDTAASQPIMADEKVVFGAYFELLRIPLLEGTTCDTQTVWERAVVNRSFVTHYFPNGRAIGHRLQITQADLKPEIVGVVADAREDGPNNAPIPAVYWCSTNASPSPYFLLRTRGDSASLTGAIKQAVHEAAPERSVFGVASLNDRLVETTAENRFRMVLLGLFAATAISLAAIGLYATLSYLIAIRRKEIGLRMALGAVPRQIRNRFLAQGTGISMLGCIAGFAVALAASRLIAGLLYGISAVDPVTYLGVAVGVLLVASIASILPAMQAARLDPMAVLREE